MFDTDKLNLEYLSLPMPSTGLYSKSNKNHKVSLMIYTTDVSAILLH